MEKSRPLKIPPPSPGPDSSRSSPPPRFPDAKGFDTALVFELLQAMLLVSTHHEAVALLHWWYCPYAVVATEAAAWSLTSTGHLGHDILLGLLIHPPPDGLGCFHEPAPSEVAGVHKPGLPFSLPPAS
jgi:hypothetical protein